VLVGTLDDGEQRSSRGVRFGVQLIRRGPLFDVFRDGARCIKRPSSVPRAERLAALAVIRTDSNETNIFGARRFGWYGDGEVPGDSYFETLLVAEQRVIERAAGEWNHPGARFEGGALVMPWCDALDFAGLSPDEQRRCFPRMLPALWTALAFCPHGDLKPDAFLLEAGGWFRILDPGVSVAGPARRRTSPGGFDLQSALMTSNGAHYPLLPPEHGPDAPRQRAGPPLVELLPLTRLTLFGPPPEVATGRGDSPSAADALALGAIYFALLTERTIAGELGLEEPLWCGGWSDSMRGRPVDRVAPTQTALEAGVLERALRRADSLPVEAELCMRLVRGADAATLSALAHEAMRALEASRLW
jgi:hypothetical protein